MGVLTVGCCWDKWVMLGLETVVGFSNCFTARPLIILFGCYYVYKLCVDEYINNVRPIK